MSEDKVHKNSQKRIYGDYTYFITCMVKDRIEFFICDLFGRIWIKELNLSKKLLKFKLLAFCLNYDHFHLIIKPDSGIANYSGIIHFLKRHFTRNINIVLGYNKFDTINCNVDEDVGDEDVKGDVVEGDVGQRRLQQQREPWQIEMDDFIAEMRKKFIKLYGLNHNFIKFKWQKSFHDHIIRNQNDLQNHWNYTMYNYAKHKLPENWQYTGLNYPEMIDEM